MERTLRCEITKNPCGTDTWPIGSVCVCKNCTKYLTNNHSLPHLEDKSLEDLVGAKAIGALPIPLSLGLNLLTGQESLGQEFQKILDENRWDLYEQ